MVVAVGRRLQHALFLGPGLAAVGGVLVGNPVPLLVPAAGHGKPRVHGAVLVDDNGSAVAVTAVENGGELIDIVAGVGINADVDVLVGIGRDQLDILLDQHVAALCHLAVGNCVSKDVIHRCQHAVFNGGCKGQLIALALDRVAVVADLVCIKACLCGLAANQNFALGACALVASQRECHAGSSLDLGNQRFCALALPYGCVFGQVNGVACKCVWVNGFLGLLFGRCLGVVARFVCGRGVGGVARKHGQRQEHAKTQQCQ